MVDQRNKESAGAYEVKSGDSTPERNAGATAGASDAFASKAATVGVEDNCQTKEHQYHQHHRQRTGRDAAAWTDRTREALVAATIGAAHAGKSYLR